MSSRDGQRRPRAEREDHDDGHEDHRAYTNIRARQIIERLVATARFMAKCMNKDGSISRAKPDRDTWLRDAFVTAEEAEKRRAVSRR